MTKEEAAVWLDAVAGVVGISIAAHQRPGVIANLQSAARMAELTFSVPLDDFDSAPSFVPVGPHPDDRPR